ncbi:MAG TPA: polysaccharide deacetylase family protein [Terracidiphilus sp.]|jgi:peptidoglycan/xylan/chitin deacetylase (PgdA/CDA1 family)
MISRETIRLDLPESPIKRHTGNRMFSPLSIGIVTGLSATAGAALTAGGFAYASLWPGSQLFGSTLIAPPKPGEVALTFDDGPNASWTPRLLELLAIHEIRASFFLVGSRAQAEPALVRRIAAAGHLIGNHSWSHLNLAWASVQQIEDELRRASQLLEQITGKPVRYFRPPFGARRPAVLRAARRLGLVPVMWNAMTSDWKSPSADVIASRLMRKIDSLTRHGRAANIVLHDGGHLDPTAHRGPSVAAAGQLIAQYKQSRRFVTVDAWDHSQPSVPGQLP